MIAGPPPMRVLYAGALLHLIAALFALLVARRRGDCWPVAAFLAVTALTDIVLVATMPGAPTSIPEVPLAGMERVVAHGRVALWLVWPFGFAAMFVAIFARRHPWAVGAAYVVTITVLVLGYPSISGETLRQAYTAIELAALAVAAGALVQWAWRRESPRLPHVMSIMLLATEVAVFFVGPWTHDIFAGWTPGRIMYGLTYAAAAVISGGMLWIRRSPSS